MPLYFAYGANLDHDGMAVRCPRSTALEPAWLAGYRFFIMADGYASVRPEIGAVVHGLLWRLPAQDVAALDAYEEIDAGLYTKVTLPVATHAASVRALVYVATSPSAGLPRAGYMEAVLTAATACHLPIAYLDELGAWLPSLDKR